MSMQEPTLPEIINNIEERYEGDLTHYARILFFKAPNLRHPYHNGRHMLHVTWLCYLAIVYYGDQLTARQARHLLVAALLHDFDHSGRFGNDDLNIERAVRALRQYAHPDDEPYLGDIEALIRASEFPPKMPVGELTLSMRIIRDADKCQVLSKAWLQQVIVGLADEWGKAPLEVLRAQPSFLAGLRFHTSWARRSFPQEVIDAKIAEAEDWVRILDPK